MESIKGIGSDIVATSRIEKMVRRFGDRVENRFLCHSERELLKESARPFLFIAGRVAIKEAVYKSLGLPDNTPIRWDEYEVKRLASGAPSFEAHGDLKTWCSKHGIKRILVTLSHETEYAVGMAVAIESLG